MIIYKKLIVAKTIIELRKNNEISLFKIFTICISLYLLSWTIIITKLYMFNFFRKKPILADLIPEGFVDIHSHILPGIDDGSKDVEESHIINISNERNRFF